MVGSQESEDHDFCMMDAPLCQWADVDYLSSTAELARSRVLRFVRE